MRKCKGVLALLLSLMITVTFTPSIAFAGSGDDSSVGSDIVAEQQDGEEVASSDAEASKEETQPVEKTPVLRGEGEQDPEPETDYVAMIGETGYSSLKDALDAAHEMTGDVTIALLESITEVVVIHQKDGLNLTVDGGGNTITGQIYIDGDGRYNGSDTLAIKNTKFVYDAGTYDDAFIDMPSTKTTGKIYTTGKYNYAHNITVEGCAFTGEGTTTVAVRVASAAGAHNLTLKNNTVTGGHSFAQLVGVKDLTITGNMATGVKNGINVSGGDGTAAVTGNAISANGYTIRFKDGNSCTVTMEDNTFSGSEGIVNTSTGDTAITINSGTYTGPLDVGNNGTITVAGGTFSVDVSEYCVEGLVCVPDPEHGGQYIVKEHEYAAQVGDQKFESLEEAFEAAQAGDTVELLMDTKIESIAVDKKIILDLNGKKVSSDGIQLFAVSKNGDLTIKGNGTVEGPANGEAFDGNSLIIVDEGKLTIEDGTFTATGSGSDGMYGVYILNGGTAIFGTEEGGPAITSHFAAIGTNNTTAPATITVYNGTYTANANPENDAWWYYFCAPIYAASSGDYTIAGGTFNGYYGVSSRYANVEQTLSIEGGTFNASSGTQLFTDVQTGSAGAADRVIISKDNSLSVPDGYGWAEEGDHYVLKTPFELAMIEASAELDEVDIDSYIEEHQYKVFRLVEKAKSDVDAAKSESEVDSIMSSFRESLAKYKKTADVKAEAIAALEAYKSNVEFADENARGEIVAEGSANINEAATSTAIYKALADAKEAIDALQTKAGKEKADAKAALAAAVEEARAKMQGDVEYTDETAAALEAALAEAEEVLADDEATKRQYNKATTALENAIAGLITKEDAEKAAAKALADAKKAALAKLNKTKPSNYIEPERSVVKKAIAGAKKTISNATTIAAVDRAVAKANKTIKAQGVYNAKLPKVTSQKAKSGKKAITAKWKKLSKKNRKKVSGIEIQYAENKAFTKKAKMITAKKSTKSKTIKKLAAKKTYWVRVRTFKKTSTGKQVSGWSKVQKVKTK